MGKQKNIFTIFIVLALAAAVVLFFVFINKSILGGGESGKKVYKVGVLSGFAYIAAITDGLKAGMAELGYIEGEDIVFDVREVEPDPGKYRAALQELAAEKVDVMVAFPTEASLEGKKVDKETGIPLVFAHANFEGMNLINSIKEPGNNLTGVRYPGPDVALKRLEILMKILPAAKNILIPYHNEYPNVPPQLDILHEWAPKWGINIIEMPVGSTEELNNKLKALFETGRKVDAIMTLSEIVSADPAYTAVWGKFAADNKIPTGGALLLKKDGFPYETLFGVDADAFPEGQQAAKLVDKILRGTSAGTIPVESAEMLFRLNYKLATEMGITLSEILLSTADKIIR